MLANAKSLTFGNGDPNSTSGYLVLGYYVFAKNNVDPGQAFKRTLNSSHEVNALAVANKQVDVATYYRGHGAPGTDPAGEGQAAQGDLSRR